MIQPINYPAPDPRQKARVKNSIAAAPLHD